MKDSLSHVSNNPSLHRHHESRVPGVSRHRESDMENFVHELRQPLSVIESLAFYLELTSKDDSARHHFQQIQAMVKRAHHILAEAAAQ